MGIPLPDLIREHRVAAFKQQKNSVIERQGLNYWKTVALNPGAYRILTGLSARAVKLLKDFPFLQKITPLLGGWKNGRTLMNAKGKTFQALLKSRQKHD